MADLGGVVVRDYSLWIFDDRSEAPTLVLASVADDARAEEVAREQLGRSVHRVSVEVRRGERLVVKLVRDDLFRL